MRLPDRGISVAVMCNSAGSNATSFARQMAEAMVPDLRPAIAPDTVSVDAATVSRIAGVYRSTRTYEPLFVGVAGPGGGRGGAAVRGLRSGGLMVGNNRVIVDTGADGRPTGLRQIAASGDTVAFTYTGATPWTPSAADLNAFVGQYRSDEIRSVWTARVDSGRVVLSSRRGSRQVLTPVYRDAFAGGSFGTVWFSRDARGEVDAMHVSNARLWNLTIPRVRTTQP